MAGLSSRFVRDASRVVEGYAPARERRSRKGIATGRGFGYTHGRFLPTMGSQPQPERRSISHYELIEKVGEGGMGVVYRANDLTLDRIVALKFLRSSALQSPDHRSRLVQEARAVSRLSHRHIAVIHAIEEHEGDTFLVFEYLPGGTLRSVLESAPAREHGLDARQAAAYGAQIADGLAHAHANGIIHRDIKPGNIMFARDGGLKVVDFGISRMADAATQTETGTVQGTPPYMSPEQAAGKPVDARSDIFSLGLVLYEMVAGRPAFAAGSAAAVAHRILYDEVPSLPAGCPTKLAAIIRRALEKSPDARYQRMVELADDLKAFLSAPGTGQEIPTETIAGARRVRSRRGAILGAAVLAAAVGLLALAPLRERIWPQLPADKRVTILPFVDAAHDPANQAFCDGLLESAVATLRQLQPALVITPAVEVNRLKITDAGAARQLAGANLVVRGTVRRSGSKAQIDVSLFDPAKSRPLRSAHAAYDSGQPGSIQEKTGEAVAQLLGIAIPERHLTAASRIASANEAYLEGTGYAERYDIAGNLEKAVAALERATGQDPNFTAAYVALSTAYQRRYRDTKDRQYLDRARDSAAKALALDGSAASAHTAAAVVLSLSGDQDAAIAAFRRAMSLDRLNVDAVRELAAAYAAAGRTADAEATFRRAAELRPTDWTTLAQLGDFHNRRQQYAEAEKDFRAVIALVPDSPMQHRNLGGVYIYLGRFAEAERELLRSIELRPNASAYSNLAAAYIYLGRYREAIGVLEKALQLPSAGGGYAYTLWGNLGDAYRYTPPAAAKAPDAYAHAIQALEQQLAFDPDNAGLLATVAEYAAKRGDKARALDAIGRAMRFAHGDRKVSFRAALVYELTGSRNRALAALGEAVRGGYSVEEIAREPEFAKLRLDDGYRKLVISITNSGPR
jgi:eukaryotic-like serine/threonine-protein kinase